MKRVLVGLALALTLSACGGIQKAADAVNYSRLDQAMDQNPTGVGEVCQGRAELASHGIDDDEFFNVLESSDAFDSFPSDLGLSDRQIYDRIVSRC
jgi:hypothetical protein